MKHWQIYLVMGLMAAFAIGPVLPDPVGHAFGRQWDSHIGWACGFFVLSFVGFDALRRRGWMPYLEGWWAFVVPGLAAWIAVTIREMTDLDRIIHGGLGDPAWKSYFDVANWGLWIAVWVWVIYRTAPRFHEVVQEIRAKQLRKGKLP